jgi:hypothetical protein
LQKTFAAPVLPGLQRKGLVRKEAYSADLMLFTSNLFFNGVHEIAALSFGYFCVKTKVTAPRP